MTLVTVARVCTRCAAAVLLTGCSPASGAGSEPALSPHPTTTATGGETAAVGAVDSRANPSARAAPAAAAPPTEPVDDMVPIPAATFWMGCARDDTRCEADEKPRHRVSLDAYAIDRTEVTVRDFMLCVAAGECGTPAAEARLDASRAAPCNWKAPGRESHPMTCASAMAAAAYCRWRGKRLPTEAEWEHAARGDDERVYPWGRASPGGQAYCRGPESTCPVGSFPAGASPFGVLDMAGNAAEWVSDTYHPAYYGESPLANPRGPVGPIPLVYQACAGGPCPTARGGSWRSSEAALRATARSHHAEGTVIDVGFRCARTEPAPGR